MDEFQRTQSQMSEDMEENMRAAIVANKKRAQLLETKRERERKRRLKKKELKQKNMQSCLDAEDSMDSQINASQVSKVVDEEAVFRYSDEESAQLAYLIDKSYDKLFGKLNGPQYKAVKNKAWAKCVESINQWHVDRKNFHNGKIVERDEESLKRKFENLKKRGTCIFIFMCNKLTNPV